MSKDYRSNADGMLDILARCVQIIGRDAELRKWFLELEKKSAVQRSNYIHLTCQGMIVEGKDNDLVCAFRLLADARVFAATRQALRECGYIED
jgi:hypothetical protein